MFNIYKYELKRPTHVLNEEQITWIKSAQKKVYELIRETPPLGYKFGQNVKVFILELIEIENK